MSSVSNAFYAQSGGVTAVINASACGLFSELKKNKKKINKIYAGKNGIVGALNEEIIDISNHVRLWAKGFYHQQEHLLLNKENYMNGINWVSNWYRVHFYYKVFEYISHLLLVLIICYCNQLYLFQKYL